MPGSGLPGIPSSPAWRHSAATRRGPSVARLMIVHDVQPSPPPPRPAQGLLRPPARPHRVLHARRGGAHRRPVHDGGRDGHAGPRHHRPRLRLRRLRVLEEGPEYGVKPIIGVEAYVTPGTHRTDKTRVKWGDEPGRDDVSGSGAYTHMTLLARNNNGLHNLFRMSTPGQPREVYSKPRIDRELLDLRPGPGRHDGLPVRRGPDPAAARSVQGGGRRRPPTSATSSAPRTTTAS